MLYRAGQQESPLPVQRLDSRLIAGLAASPDAVEGVASFLERRPPVFPGIVPADLPDDLPG
jgi:enoyl-CoA hydratase/carnithine racemase